MYMGLRATVDRRPLTRSTNAFSRTVNAGGEGTLNIDLVHRKVRKNQPPPVAPYAAPTSNMIDG